jgi:hypothetical protein
MVEISRVSLQRHAPCDRALLSAAEAVSQSGIPTAILVQPAPQGVPALSHQIRHQPSSKRTSAKSAFAGVAAIATATRPIAKAKRFIARFPLSQFAERAFVIPKTAERLSAIHNHDLGGTFTTGGLDSGLAG